MSSSDALGSITLAVAILGGFFAAGFAAGYRGTWKHTAAAVGTVLCLFLLPQIASMLWFHHTMGLDKVLGGISSFAVLIVLGSLVGAVVKRSLSSRAGRIPPLTVCYDIVDGSKGTIRVRARVTLLPAASGGRGLKYRPNHNFGDSTNRNFYIGQLEFGEGEWMHPGETKELQITFLNVKSLREMLRVGTKWRIQEGMQLVANAEVLELMDAPSAT